MKIELIKLRIENWELEFYLENWELELRENGERDRRKRFLGNEISPVLGFSFLLVSIFFIGYKMKKWDKKG